jgi:putative zinc-binding metallo-peptidase
VDSGDAVGLTAAIAVAALALDAPKPETLAMLDALATTYEIVIKRPTTSFAKEANAIRGEPARAEDLDAAAPILAAEIGKYPPTFFRRTLLTYVVLCRELHGDVGSPAGVAVPGEVFLDVSLATGTAAERDYFRISVHHEIFHAIDICDVTTDAEWMLLNPARFTYAPRVGPARPRPPALGFVSSYATTNVREDRAETFARLMTARAEWTKRAADDEVLKSKFEAIQEFALERDSEMNAAFWARVATTVSGV